MSCPGDIRTEEKNSSLSTLAKKGQSQSSAPNHFSQEMKKSCWQRKKAISVDLDYHQPHQSNIILQARLDTRHQDMGQYQTGTSQTNICSDFTQNMSIISHPRTITISDNFVHQKTCIFERSQPSLMIPR